MELSDLTSIGRTIDLDYATNRAIVIVTGLVTLTGILFQRLQGGAWIEGALWGVNHGLTVFLAWVVCRELDPDHPVAAFAAVALALPALLIWDLPWLTAVLWVVILMRILNRSVGLPAGVLDTLGFVGLAGWLSLQGNWGYGVITALALFIDSRLPDPARRQLPFALLAVAVTAVAALLGRGAAAPGPPSLTAGLIALALSVLFLPVFLTSGRVQSAGDATGEPLAPARVRTAQALALLAGVEVAFVAGLPGLRALSPLWAAAVGAALTWFVNYLRR